VTATVAATATSAFSNDIRRLSLPYLEEINLLDSQQEVFQWKKHPIIQMGQIRPQQKEHITGEHVTEIRIY
jgi:hypothetical protein